MSKLFLKTLLKHSHVFLSICRTFPPVQPMASFQFPTWRFSRQVHIHSSRVVQTKSLQQQGPNIHLVQMSDLDKGFNTCICLATTVHVCNKKKFDSPFLRKEKRNQFAIQKWKKMKKFLYRLKKITKQSNVFNLCFRLYCPCETVYYCMRTKKFSCCCS